MAPIRRAGRARILDGAWIVWSEAVGSRGTRWRESIESDGGVARVTLLETTKADRLSRLEIAAAAGLLTLHPEPDESALHGNLVSADGVRHLALPWSPDHELLLLRSPASATVTLRRLAARIEIGASLTVDVVRVDDRLDPRPATWTFARVADGEWRLRSADGGDERALSLDPSGRPVLAEAIEWPLEA
jgi:hypothetical protein